jgi:hypothetical protein
LVTAYTVIVRQRRLPMGLVRRVMRSACSAWGNSSPGGGQDLQVTDLVTAVATAAGVVGDRYGAPGQGLELPI